MISCAAFFHESAWLSTKRTSVTVLLSLPGAQPSLPGAQPTSSRSASAPSAGPGWASGPLRAPASQGLALATRFGGLMAPAAQQRSMASTKAVSSCRRCWTALSEACDPALPTVHGPRWPFARPSETSLQTSWKCESCGTMAPTAQSSSRKRPRLPLKTPGARLVPQRRSMIASSKPRATLAHSIAVRPSPSPAASSAAREPQSASATSVGTLASYVLALLPPRLPKRT
mmetsp:Transcript_5716/g.17682  ORF Transcript_5716/g.17682 Transcript_5716/m.17682 type:complete len:229 (-) Transcript_5716:1093-1779(-)